MRIGIVVLAGLVGLGSGIVQGANAAAPAAGAPAAKSGGPRAVEQFTTGWKFVQDDAAGAEKPGFDDAAWKAVTLPHDWSIAGPVKEDAPSRGAGGFFPTGIGWYRKTFTVAAADATPTAARRKFIVFDGVMANSDVYLNGELLGHRPYGYVSFVYELTPHLKPGQNVIAVKVDDSQQPASRWYSGAGINRQVRLVTTGDTHMVPWGTFVTAPQVSAEMATVHVRATVTNETTTAGNVLLQVKLTGPNGAAVKTSSASPVQPLYLAPGATADIDYEVNVASPDRWDIGHGAMYTAHATLLREGKPVDSEDVPFGIRLARFDADKGFFLNGVHHKVYGVALHTDGGAVGTAVPLAVWERRLTELRKLGVNAIRTAHNPPAPEFLDLADRMGFLVMDEMFDCWTVAKNTYDYHLYFKDWATRDTTDTVMRDRNHPSVILWSAGNEIHDTPKPEIALPILANLVKTFHLSDNTRPVTQALFRPNASHDYEDGLADLLDVVGQNYREAEILKAHADKPTRKIIGTENTHDRNQWVAMRDHPEYSGQFLWAGIDYLGEAGRWPAIGSGSGLLLSNGLTRPRAFERQSWWTTTPMVAMARSVAQRRAAPIDPGYANTTTTNQAAEPVGPQPGAGAAAGAGARGARPATAAGAAAGATDPTVRFSQPLLADWTPKDLGPHTETVEVYTNAEEVELSLNGKSLGTQKLHPDASAITFKVPFEPGTLKAVAKSHGATVATDVLKTAGKPAKLVLTADGPNTPITPEWNDVRYMTATLEDADGTRIPDSATEVQFVVNGPVQVIAVDNGDMMDHEPFQAAERKLYDGKVCAIVRATGPSGKVTVTATANGVTAGSVTLTAGPAEKEDAVLAKAVEGHSF